MATTSKSLARDAAVGALILAALILLGYMAARLGAVGGYGGGRELTMVFDDATGLVESAPIAASGVKIGAVTKIEYADGGAKITAKIQPGIEIHADATASVRAKSLLGEKFVALDPGTEKAGPLSGDRVRTVPTADIDRMAASVARLMDALDPQDVKDIAHGMAVALSDADGMGKTMPGAIRDAGRDLHELTVSLEALSAQGNDMATKLKPVIAHLDELATKSSRTLDDVEPTLKKLPGTVDHLEAAIRRADALLAKADTLDKDELERDLKRIFEEEGVYVRLKPRKIGPGKSAGKTGDGDEAAPTPTPKPLPSPPRL